MASQVLLLLQLNLCINSNETFLNHSDKIILQFGVTLLRHFDLLAN